MIAGGKPNLIGISGKMGSGKDTLYIVMNYVADKFATESIADWEQPVSEFTYANKKYSEKLKYMVCFLLGCDRSDLEDREFKEKELGEEWWKWEITFEDNFEGYIDYVGNEKHYEDEDMIESHLIKLTPRKLLQLLGTEAGRQIIHPNIWVNALFADYRETVDFDNNLPPNTNWIITDVRFPNEAQAIKDRGGILIRINRRQVTNNCSQHSDGLWYTSEHGEAESEVTPVYANRKNEHLSETALDDYDGFDYVIENDSDSVQDLVDKVKQLKIV